MCSPELRKGICQICMGTLTLENEHVDRDGNRWDVHRGVCAILAGEVPYQHQAAYSNWMQRLHRASTNAVRDSIRKAFYKWVRQVATENHYVDNVHP
jgi:hypothetical protein